MSDLVYRNLGINKRTAKKLDEMWLLSGITKSELMDISLSIVYEMMIDLCKAYGLTYKESLIAISEQVPREVRQMAPTCQSDGLRPMDEVLKSLFSQDGEKSMFDSNSHDSESSAEHNDIRGDGQC